MPLKQQPYSLVLPNKLCLFILIKCSCESALGHQWTKGFKVKIHLSWTSACLSACELFHKLLLFGSIVWNSTHSTEAACEQQSKPSTKKAKKHLKALVHTRHELGNAGDVWKLPESKVKGWNHWFLPCLNGFFGQTFYIRGTIRCCSSPVSFISFHISYFDPTEYVLRHPDL